MESVSQRASIDGLANGQLRYYRQNSNDYVQVFWTVSDTLSYFMQFNCTAGTGALFKSGNGTITQIKSL